MTEPKLLERSSLLEGALAKKQYSEFCEHKIQSSETEEDKNLWSFLKVLGHAMSVSGPPFLQKSIRPPGFLIF